MCSMRKFLSLPLVFLLTACANSDVKQVGDFVLSSFDKTQQKVSRERAAAVPYATMGVELGSSAQALLILGTIAQDELDWFAGEQVFVRTRNGRVIRTAGLPYDLGGLRDLSTNSAPAGPGGSGPRQFLLDFPDLGIFGATAQCSMRDMGEDSVEIL